MEHWSLYSLFSPVWIQIFQHHETVSSSSQCSESTFFLCSESLNQSFWTITAKAKE